LFEVIITQSVFEGLSTHSKNAFSERLSFKFIITLRIQVIYSFFSNAKSLAFFIFTVEISSIALVIFAVFLIEPILLLISFQFAMIKIIY